MSESLFSEFPELDAAYLDDAYGQEAETAALVFEQYLQDLPGNLQALKESFQSGDAAALRQRMHKQKPAFSYVGLTDITEKLHHLEASCQTAADIQANKALIEQVLQRMDTTRPVIEKALQRLQQA
jgi:Hpt domain